MHAVPIPQSFEAVGADASSRLRLRAFGYRSRYIAGTVKYESTVLSPAPLEAIRAETPPSSGASDAGVQAAWDAT